VGAISGAAKTRHTIDQDKCVRCGMCFNTCKFEAIAKA
jgi:Fe-S-cluster-containing hydrogenase component 2